MRMLLKKPDSSVVHWGSNLLTKSSSRGHCIVPVLDCLYSSDNVDHVTHLIMLRRPVTVAAVNDQPLSLPWFFIPLTFTS